MKDLEFEKYKHLAQYKIFGLYNTGKIDSNMMYRLLANASK